MYCERLEEDFDDSGWLQLFGVFITVLRVFDKNIPSSLNLLQEKKDQQQK